MADNTENINYKITVNAETGTAVVRDLKGQIIATKVPVEQLRKEFGNFAKTVNSTRFNKFNKGLKDITSTQEQLKSASGSATAATMELGRVISDAPYGIRGMANNITQLVAQLGTATVKAGSFKNAIQLMYKSLMGPIGIVLAITAVVSALDYFNGGQKKAEKNTKKTTKAIEKQITPLQKLINLYKTISSIAFGDSDNQALLSYNKNILTLDETVKIITRNFNEFSNAYEKFNDEQKSDKKLVKQLVSAYQELLTLRDDEKKQVKKMQELRKIVASQDLKQQNSKLKVITEEKLALIDLERVYIKTQKRLLDLDEYFKKQDKDKGKDKGKKISPFKTPKELELDIKNNEKAILDFNSKILQEQLKIEFNDKISTAKTEKEKNKIRQEYSAKRLLIQIENERKTLELKKKTELEIAKAKTESHKDDLKRAYELYKYKIENDPDLKDSPEAPSLLKKAKDTYDAAKKQADTELTDTLEGIEERYKPLFSLFSKLSIERVKALFGDPKNKDKEDAKIETDLEKMAAYAEAAKQILGGITEFINGEFDRQLTIEENKTNALNNELNKRLLNENLSKEARENIQNQIAQNDERLRVKQEKIERKRFKMQKAANIALAMVDTFRAGVGVMADTRGGSIARIAGMTAVIASGLLSVATIARQKFQSSAGSSPLAGGVSSTDGGRAEPSFNIVGRSNDNLLLNAIQSQFDQPLRAYVVARDVTNQQQMDGIITDAAGT